MCSMTDTVDLCVVVSQNETAESAEAVMNVPQRLLARMMHWGWLLRWTRHFERDFPLDTSRQRTFPSRDKAESYFVSLAWAKDRLCLELTWISRTSTRRHPFCEDLAAVTKAPSCSNGWSACLPVVETRIGSGVICSGSRFWFQAAKHRLHALPVPGCSAVE